MSAFIALSYFVISMILSLLSLLIFPDFDSSKLVEYYSIVGYENFVEENGYTFSDDYVNITTVMGHPILILILAAVSLVLSYLQFYELEA